MFPVVFYNHQLFIHNMNNKVRSISKKFPRDQTQLLTSKIFLIISTLKILVLLKSTLGCL